MQRQINRLKSLPCYKVCGTFLNSPHFVAGRQSSAVSDDRREECALISCGPTVADTDSYYTPLPLRSSLPSQNGDQQISYQISNVFVNCC